MTRGGWNEHSTGSPAPGVVYGGFWVRLVAAVIDALMLLLIGGIASSIVGSLTNVMAILGLAYVLVCWGVVGHTLGMAPFGLRIVRGKDGSRMNWLNVLLRLVGCIPAGILAIGFFWAAFEPRKRGWHDMIAGTVVIRNA